jgi:xylulokinase
LNAAAREETIWGLRVKEAIRASRAVDDTQLKDIKTWNPVASEFTAKKENAEIYRKHYEVFRSLYERNKDLMKTLGN